MASETPARALGLEKDMGRLVPGARADLILVDEATWSLRSVLVGGKPSEPTPEKSAT
jgi:N-acetylglucosamine-6-phosphate deacetylase